MGANSQNITSFPSHVTQSSANTVGGAKQKFNSIDVGMDDN